MVSLWTDRSILSDATLPKYEDLFLAMPPVMKGDPPSGVTPRGVLLGAPRVPRLGVPFCFFTGVTLPSSATRGGSASGASRETCTWTQSQDRHSHGQAPPPHGQAPPPHGQAPPPARYLLLRGGAALPVLDAGVAARGFGRRLALRLHDDVIGQLVLRLRIPLRREQPREGDRDQDHRDHRVHRVHRDHRGASFMVSHITTSGAILRDAMLNIMRGTLHHIPTHDEEERRAAEALVIKYEHQLRDGLIEHHQDGLYFE
ncbi:hypothetical protein EYF80_057853 [Liparis tanakae]|uniref:Uncharacterized protein n=1 Tax=Liparis tanakae TaxID=230148 RepID=A0A4Z2ESU1_9TELE|nr:hypothetical protein EYF80_057853 [Liparis tanakae]